MVTKSVIAPLIVVVILAGIGGILTAQKVTQNRLNQTRQSAATEASKGFVQTSTESTAGSIDDSINAKPGRYAEYSEVSAKAGYQNTILFFYASWCPECRSFKQNLETAKLPENTQILEVNYDKSDELKKKYLVTLQSTFVNVDESGSQKIKWVGYGKDKSLEAVLKNLQVQ